MPDLNEALASLRPIDYADVPTSDLSSFLKTAFKNAEIVINSIPPSSSSSGGDSSSTTSPNSAKKATDTITSGTPTAIDERNASLHKGWGKPYNMKEKDNPLHVAVYKMSAHDKHGAWFARRSIHQGLGFEKWKHAMQIEFAESVKVEGGPASGAVRGIGADRRVEHEVVEGVGELTVWQLSAIFGPVTPREFLTLVMTSDNALSNASALDGASGTPPRHYMVVSRPTSHTDVQLRDNLVKGQYESIEMIRELPKAGKEGDSESNPIEWMMITRSDPGGGIPRFMVERGTPGGVVGDTVKFLDWACKQDDTEEHDGHNHTEPAPPAAGEKDLAAPAPMSAPASTPAQAPATAPTAAPAPAPAPAAAPAPAVAPASVPAAAESVNEPASTGGESGVAGGLLASVASAATYVGATASAYIPLLHSTEDPEDEDEDDDATSESSEVSSDEEFRSADEGDSVSVLSSPTVVKQGSSSPILVKQSPSHQQQGIVVNHQRNVSTLSDTNSVASSTTTKQSITADLVQGKEPSNHHEKELLKIHSKRAQLDEKATIARKSEELKARTLDETEVKNAGKAKEKFEKEKKKREEKYEKEARKLEEKRLKEERKAEEKRRKAVEKDEVLKARRERDEAREKCASAEQEVELLRKQIQELRHEHAALLAKVNIADGGVGA